MMMKQILFFLTTASWTHKAPLVFAPECDRLQSQLGNACCGNRFLLMTNLTGNQVRDDLRLLLQLTLPITWITGKPVIQLDTTSSQQLSSKETLCHGGGHDKVVQDLNLVRGFLQGGMGDISHYEDWTVRSDRHHKKLLSRIGDHVSFMEALQKEAREPVRLDNFYTGHEVGFLPYEEQMTRNDSMSGKVYGCSSHFLWVGLDDDQMVDYLCEVENPVGLVVTETFSRQKVLETIKKLNPINKHGKMTLLVQKMPQRTLARLVDCVCQEGMHVVWCCDDDAKFLVDFLHMHNKKKTNVGGLFLRNHQNALKVLRVLSRHWKKKPSTPTPSWNRFSLE